jgi:hypothetical protein
VHDDAKNAEPLAPAQRLAPLLREALHNDVLERGPQLAPCLPNLSLGITRRVPRIRSGRLPGVGSKERTIVLVLERLDPASPWYNPVRKMVPFLHLPHPLP